jgi:hypothetical protein
MKQVRMIAPTLMAMALIGLGAPTASATTLEVKGVKQTAAIAIKASLKAGTSTLISDTAGFFLNTCTASTFEGKTVSPFSGTSVVAPLSSLTFTSCKEEPLVVHSAGSLSIENIAGTTNGTVRSLSAKWTMSSPFGGLTCVTAASPGTDIGTLTGVGSATATLDFNAALLCGAITTKVAGTYSLTSPEGLGVAS